MSQQFRLIELNQALGLKNGFHQNLDDRYRDASMPHDVEETISSIFSSVDDKSLFSIELDIAAESLEQPSLLSIYQFQYLQSFNYSGINNVLDLSEDTGGVAHFIADKVGQIESIKIDPALAKLAVNRCSNNHNVAHISEDLSKLTFPESHYDLIILGQLEELGLNKLQLAALLAKLQKSLTSQGVLVASLFNSQRLSQWFNPEPLSSEQKTPFSDLYQVGGEHSICKELNRKELRDLFLSSEFPHIGLHANFSKSKNCQVLLSEDFLTASVNCANHFYNSNFIDNSDLNEYLVAKNLIANKQNLTDVATRFVAIVGNTKTAIDSFYQNDFSYFADPELAKHHQTISHRPRSALDVQRHSTNSLGSDDKDTFVSLNLAPSPYFKGPLLAGQWLEAVYLCDSGRFSELVIEYASYLNEQSREDGFQKFAYNVLPSNLILNARGARGFNIANSKWQVNTELSHSFVLFKALLEFAQNNLSVLQTFAIRNDLATVGLFIIQHMPNVFQLAELKTFIELEERIQSEIRADFIPGDVERFINLVFTPIDEYLDSTVSDVQESSVDSIITGQAQQLTQYRESNDYLQQRIEDLREHRVEVVERLKDQTSLASDKQARMQAEIDHLHERLHAQHVRNDELHGYLLMRPTTRAKRVARRTMNRLTGQAVVEHQVVNDAAEKIEEQPIPLGELIGQNTEDYDLWISENTLSEVEIANAKSDIEAMTYTPVFSILVPIYNTDPEYLLPMIESVRNQIYPHWQLCLVDDSSPKTYLKRILEHEALQDERITVQLNDVNQGISVATNDALAMAKGDYIALLDHDDEISIDALYENAKVINKYADVGLIYSDEDKMEMDGTRLQPYFKPDFSPDLLHTNNYICHFTIIKKTIADDIGGFREGLDGSQDHDIIIRAAAAAERIVHIPKILYHWRKIPGSTAVEYDSKSYAWEAGRKAVEDQLQKQEEGVHVEFGTLKGTYRVHREIHGEPLVSIIIPFKDKPELLDSCLNSILNRSSYKNIEIIGVSNNSEQDLTFARMQYFSELDSRIKFVEKNVPFNFSAICNFGVDQAKGEYIVLLNNDIEIISPDWLEQMLQNAQRPEIGAVGGKLLYPDGRIQHAGVVTGMVGAAGHPHKFFPDNHIGYHGRLHMAYNVSAITGAMMMMKTTKFKEVGGFDEDNLAVAYNDIDLCLKLLGKGYYNLFTPHAKATHHESISRGYEDTDEKMQRLLKEQSYFLSTWSDFLASGDPFYNPNLSLKNERFSLNFKD
jgi:glycosyltransferase involved in cell wall biosynthesis